MCVPQALGISRHFRAICSCIHGSRPPCKISNLRFPHWPCEMSYTLYHLSDVRISGVGCIYQRCVGVLPREAIKWCHRFSLSWTWAVRVTQNLPYVFSVWWILLKIPATPTTDVTSLQSVFIRQNYFHCETLSTFFGIASNVADIFYHQLWSKVSTFSTMLTAHPRTFSLCSIWRFP